jgi:hypothetical protein
MTTFFASRVPQPGPAVQRKAIACAAVILIPLVLLACASTTQGKVYQSISACNATEQTAMRAFGALYQANKAADPVLWGARYDKAQAAHASYEKIRDAAVDAAKSGGETQAVLASINEALTQLQALLATFGVK